ncbi:RNA polymerase sigma factor [Enhygromyxa salina]|uniref:ECF RNA polymerase sigma-E factor n=1 Tax=Enhygromyxa salina TaxID=215803 RepID=A0A2S9YWP4_9BACT|nr:sigma-70 family RNA polymerase sigma factor [Enhygromyxa salina]PRQ09507.1 ECF RNA polymerase sigma-E factor [Enhygromyxa salina]
MPPTTPKPATSANPRSDADLLGAWRGGDSEAGEVLFVRHYPPVARFFRNKVGADQVADLIQDTFTATLEGRDRIEDGSRFRSYLLCIAYRVFCGHLRANYRKQGEVDLDAVPIEDVDASPTSVIVHAQEQRLLLEGLRAIPINYQVVLELHYWEDMSTEEIAVVLEIPSGTVRSRLIRARDALEAAMAGIARSADVLDSTLTRLDDWAAACGQKLAAVSR